MADRRTSFQVNPAGGTGGIAIGSLIVTSFVLVAVIISGAVIGVKVWQTQSDLDTLRTITPPPTLGAVCTTEPKALQRREDAYSVRNQRSFAQYSRAIPCHPNNGDEELYSPVYFSQFSKGMPHDELGHVDPVAYQALIKAVTTWVPADFNAIPQAPGAVRDFTNPQAGLSYVLQGGDSHSFYQPPAPAFASAEQAGEMVEVYYMWYLRDVSFADYATDPKAAEAVAGLSVLTDFRGPKPVTPANLFRGLTSGCEVGPYISQFLYGDCMFGSARIEQRLTPPLPGIDYMTNWTTYLAQQRAQEIEAEIQYNETRRYIINGRDGAHWVHMDVLFQAYFTAMLGLLERNAPLKSNIPYQISELNQMGFASFGGPDIATYSTISATSALKAVWFEKWFAHRRLRPEVFAARIHSHLTSAYSYPFHDDVLTSSVLNRVYEAYGTYLLPMAFPEGSPNHPSYGAGHATVAGAAVTILKALFNEDWVIPNPVQPSVDGLTLDPWTGANLTVGGELNKLANNIALLRNHAGVHWRSDATESLKLGEQVAIQILKDLQATYSETFGGFTFTDFEGNVVQL